MTSIAERQIVYNETNSKNWAVKNLSVATTVSESYYVNLTHVKTSKCFSK